MALPHDEDVQDALLKLLATASEGRMQCRDIYRLLAEQFPRLTADELEVPYRNSVSHWANRVQFARLHLVRKGWILRPSSGGGRGYWTLSAGGRKAITKGEEPTQRA